MVTGSFPNSSVIFTPAIAAIALAGCVMTSGSLSSSAERLERSAYELHEDGRDEGDGYSRDAEEFAEEARDFRRVVQDQSADDDDVQDAFRDLSQSYHALRDEVERSADDDAELDFKRVTEAYLDVESEVRDDDRDRVALDD